MQSIQETVLPIIGHWYLYDDYQLFEVVAMDRDDRTIEIQHYDGMIEELDFTTWEDANIKASNAPEDWSGAYDISRLDYGVELETYQESLDLTCLDNLSN